MKIEIIIVIYPSLLRTVYVNQVYVIFFFKLRR